MRIGIVGLYHETNTFFPKPATLKDFRDYDWCVGPAVIEEFGDSHTELAGLLHAVADGGHEAVPLFYAAGETLAAATPEAESGLWAEIERALRSAGPLDAVGAVVHGAAVGQTHLDFDGRWLGKLRSRVGPAVPIVATLDSHANVSAAMVEATDALVAYRTNPHLDQFETGITAGRLLVDGLAKGKRWATRGASLPIALNIERHHTQDDPLRTWRALGDALAALEPAVVSTSLCLGFPYADVPEMGVSVLAVAERGAEDRAAALVEAWAGQILKTYRLAEPALLPVTQAAAAVRDAEGGGQPVGVLDMGDNIGGGGSGRGTVLFSALRLAGVRPGFVSFYDPAGHAACVEAGVGARLTWAVGGPDAASGLNPHPDHADAPIELTGTVEIITDGRYEDPTPVPDGRVHYKDGDDALLRLDDGWAVQFCAKRVFPVSLGQMTHLGLDPAAMRVIVIKGVHAPIAAYGPVCSEVIRVDTPGLSAANITRWPFQHRRRPMYPFESIDAGTGWVALP